ncbi:MAG: hypothetical protein ACK54F_03665 [Planctomycetia bacterium]
MKKARRIELTRAILKRTKTQHMIPFRDSYPLVEMYGLQQDAEGIYREIKDIPGWQTKWAQAYARYKALGWADDKIGRMTPLVASYEDVIWGTSGLGPSGPNISRAPIIIERGQFQVNGSMTLSYNSVTGNGPGNVFPNSVQPRGAGGTELVMRPDKWIVDDTFTATIDVLGPQANKIYAAFKTTSWSNEGTVGAYQELCGIDRIHIRGNADPYFVPGRLIVGVAAWDPGSASKFGNIYCSKIDAAFLATRGTPGDVGKVTVMNGTVSTFIFLGSTDNMWHIGDIETDDVPCVFLARKGYGRESGVSLKVSGCIKVETGVASESRGPWNGTILGDLRGRVALDFGLLAYANAGVKTESLLVLDPRHDDGGIQPQLVKGILSEWNSTANMIHEVGGNVYATPGFPYDKNEIFYKRDGDRRIVQIDRQNVAPLAGVVGAPSRLGFQRWNGSAWAPAISHAAGTPAFSYTGTATQPPQTGCTWVLGTPGAWGPCTNGVETRTTPYVSSVAGCTPSTAKPADLVETRSCTTTPPPSGTALFTRNNAAVSSNTYSEDIADVAVGRVVLTGFKNNTAAGGYSALAVSAGQVSLNYLGVYPDGNWYANGQRCTVTTASGVTTIVLPSPMTVSRLGTWAGQGGALRYTATKLELFAS